MRSYLERKFGPYGDLALTIVLDAFIMVFAIRVFGCSLQLAAGWNLSEEYSNLVKSMGYILHYGLLFLMSTFVAGDIIRSIIKCIKEVKKEWNKDGNQE